MPPMPGVHIRVGEDHQGKQGVGQGAVAPHPENQDGRGAQRGDAQDRPDHPGDSNAREPVLTCRLHRTRLLGRVLFTLPGHCTRGLSVSPSAIPRGDDAPFGGFEPGPGRELKNRSLTPITASRTDHQAPPQGPPGQAEAGYKVFHPPRCPPSFTKPIGQ